MNVSLAQVILAHLVVFGQRQPKDQAFDVAAKAIMDAKPKGWKRLMRVCGEILDADRKAGNNTEYELLVDAVKAEMERLRTAK